MIVITDGVSNTGKIDPITAADTADKFGIKIYTIGIGKDLQENLKLILIAYSKLQKRQMDSFIVQRIRMSLRKFSILLTH